MNVNKLQEGLKTKLFGKRIIFLHKTGSTNDFAKELATHGAAEGTVVIAEEQTAGRGRLGRNWFSPKGGLYLSITLKPKLKASEAVKLVYVAGLAVAEALHELYGLKTETKWPNDVLVDGKKICGILTEMSTSGEKVNFAILGIGINANVSLRAFPKELQTHVTSLKNELDGKIILEELFRVVLEKLEENYASFLKEGFVSILEKWKSYASFLGKSVEVTDATQKFHGLALDVDHEGALIIRLEDGTVKRIFSGDVTLRF